MLLKVLDFAEINKLFRFESDEELYLLIAMARRKHNPQMLRYKDQIVLRKIVHSPDEWETKMEHLLAEAHCHPYLFQIYVRFNPASSRKAYKLLKESFADWDFRNDVAKIKRIDSQWISLLQRPEATARRQYYLIDVDDLGVLDRVQGVLSALDVRAESPTPSGKHYLVTPFNVTLLSQIEGVEVKKDALFAIGYTGGELWKGYLPDT